MLPSPGEERRRAFADQRQGVGGEGVDMSHLSEYKSGDQPATVLARLSLRD